MTRSDALANLLGQQQVYAELKRLAHRQLARQPPGASLSTTALTHEACIKLAHSQGQSPGERAHWLNLAAVAMRQVICDHARQRLRRQALVESMDMADLTKLGIPHAEEQTLHEAKRLLAIDEALEELAIMHPRRAYVVSARFFGGLSELETAQAGGLSARTVQREWQVARDWLRRKLAR